MQQASAPDRFPNLFVSILFVVFNLEGIVGVLKVSILDILADLLVLEGPGAGGTAERIGGIGENELLVELLAELDGVLLGVGQGVLGDGLLLRHGVGDVGGDGSAEVDLSTVHGDVAALGSILHGGGLEGVQGHLSGLLTAEDLIDGTVDAVHQAGGGHELAGVDGPVGADHAGGLGIVAELNEQHLAELQSSQLTGGVELAVADTVDDAGLRAVADEAGGPTGGSHVGEGSAAHEGVSGLGAELEVRDDLRGLLTGQVFLGIEIALFIANEHANGVHDVNSFLVVDLVGIFESCVADGDDVLPDLIEDEIINIKDSLVKGGLKQGINTAINSAINLGKSAMGIFTGNFENLSQAQEAIKSGGIIDSLSNVLDSVLSKVTKKGWIKYGTSTLIRQGKNVILDNISKSIENSFTNQINNLDKLVKYENNWKAYYKDKNLNGMEKEYRKINEKLKELMPFETALKQARQIENLHKIIKNNGGDFNLTQEQIELSKMLV